VYEVAKYVAYVRPMYRVQTNTQLPFMCAFIDSLGQGRFTVDDCSTLITAPVPWRNNDLIPFIARMFERYLSEGFVAVHQLIDLTDMKRVLEEVEKMMTRESDPEVSSEVLTHLEALHKTLVLYLWYSYRYPIAFHDKDTAVQWNCSAYQLSTWTSRRWKRQRSSSGKKGGRRSLGSRVMLSEGNLLNGIESIRSSANRTGKVINQNRCLHQHTRLDLS
jgi:ATP-dependent RNA helicase SUPV3L1/SUV3